VAGNHGILTIWLPTSNTGFLITGSGHHQPFNVGARKQPLDAALDQKLPFSAIENGIF
jgi:hypothetical protein